MSEPTFNKCHDIEVYLSGLLAQITKANGYETDIGLERVYRGKRKISDPEIPCAVLLTGEDRPTEPGPRGEMRVEQDFVLGGYHECDADQPNDVAHQIVRDIKRAVWPESANLTIRCRTFRYQGKDIGPRADGMPVVFAIVHLTVVYAERLSDA